MDLNSNQDLENKLEENDENTKKKKSSFKFFKPKTKSKDIGSTNNGKFNTVSITNEEIISENTEEFEKTTIFNPNDGDNMSKKEKKEPLFIKIAAITVMSFIVIGIIGLFVVGGYIMNVLKEREAFDREKFITKESSIILDVNGDEIARIAEIDRRNASYDQLPQDLVNAFIAVEDSRYFEHNGFDIPRFVKVVLEAGIKKLSGSSQSLAGGSTLTMQLIKNTYYTRDKDGNEILAVSEGEEGIKRKIKEVSLALELTNNISKKDAFVNYLNIIYYDAYINGTRAGGIETACNYYFNKSVNDLTLTEAAFIAGLINAPASFNPYKDLKAATERRDTVLYLMLKHGYINEYEYNVGINTKLENELDKTFSNQNAVEGKTLKYQAYIDAVVSEVVELTGKNPSYTQMTIHTALNPELQLAMDAISNDEVDNVDYPNEWFEVGATIINNKTGELVAICGGRNYTQGKKLMFNHGVDSKRQTGSTAKPWMDYALAFEYGGWSTSHWAVDGPMYWPGSSISISNYNGVYSGDVNIQYAITDSKNTIAVQALQAAVDKVGTDVILQYLRNIGLSDLADIGFEYQYAIGGGSMGMSVAQLNACYQMLLNKGVYISPHTITKVELYDGTEPLVAANKYKPVQALSEQAAYLTTRLLYGNIKSGSSPYYNFRKSYETFAKTGTSDWGTSGYDYGIPAGAAKDRWLFVGQTNYSMAIWTGYDKPSTEHISYQTQADVNKNRPAIIAKYLLNKIEEVTGDGGYIEMPSGISSFSHTIGVYPYIRPIGSYGTSGLIKSEFVSYAKAPTYELSSYPAGTKYSVDKNILKLEWAAYPNTEQLYAVTNQKDIGNGLTGNRAFDISWLYGAPVYAADIYVNGKYIETITSYTQSIWYYSKVEGDLRFDVYYTFENDYSIKSNIVQFTGSKFTLPKISTPTTTTTKPTGN